MPVRRDIHPIRKLIRERAAQSRPGQGAAIGAAMGVALAGALIIAACAEPAAKLRQHTYPPDFQYITAEQLQMTMWQIAALTERLDQIVSEPASIPAHRIEILTLLEQLERTADEMRTEGVPSSHPLINANFDRFLDDIRQARRDVAREPPSYFRVSGLPSACRYCHGG